MNPIIFHVVLKIGPVNPKSPMLAIKRHPNVGLNHMTIMIIKIVMKWPKFVVKFGLNN